ncbi:MAG: hypothetical protein AAGA03_07780, partial [Planctomycetota bacterium]
MTVTHGVHLRRERVFQVNLSREHSRASACQFNASTNPARDPRAPLVRERRLCRVAFWPSEFSIDR